MAKREQEFDPNSLEAVIDLEHLNDNIDLSKFQPFSPPPFKIDPNKGARVSIEYVAADKTDALRALLNTQIGDADAYSASITPLNAEVADADMLGNQLADVLAAEAEDVAGTGDRRALQNGGAARLFGEATTTADADEAASATTDTQGLGLD